MWIILAVLAVVIGLLIFLLVPKSKTLDIASVSWERSVEVEENRQMQESDWTLPSEASQAHFYGALTDFGESLR